MAEAARLSECPHSSGATASSRTSRDAIARSPRRSGRRGATLLVTGAPGLGKSALLEAAIEGAADFDVLRTTGIEAESELPFASLHALLRAAAGHACVELPERQRAALASALALDASVPEGAFAAFAAVVSLLGICSERRPLLLVSTMRSGWTRLARRARVRRPAARRRTAWR